MLISGLHSVLAYLASVPCNGQLKEHPGTSLGITAPACVHLDRSLFGKLLASVCTQQCATHCRHVQLRAAALGGSRYDP